MKRDVAISFGGAAICFALFACIFAVEFKLSAWGRFNSLSLGNRPELEVALASRERILLLHQFLILPLIGILAGIFSASVTSRHLFFALITFAPFRFVYLLHDGLSWLSIASALADFFLALVASYVMNRILTRTRVASVTPIMGGY